MQLVTFANRASLVLVAACQAATAEPPAPEPAPEPPPAQRFEHDMVLRFHMHQKFDLLRGIERLLIRGKLDEGQRLAEAIAMTTGEPAHGPWAVHAVAVRD